MTMKKQQLIERKDDHLVWSDASLYSVILDLKDKQCIGTTEKSRRCTAKVSADLSSFQQDICQSEKADDVVSATLKLVLQRCCKAHHLSKLQARPLCWRAVVEKYINAYAAADLLLVEVAPNLAVLIDSIPPDRMDAYVPQEELTLHQLLKRPLMRKWGRPMDASGVVYGFTSSAWPGVVKIGCSKYSAQTRMRQLELCMPKSEVVIEQQFAFPERMEQLIHLELNSERRAVVRCSKCGRGHEEFFEFEPEDVKALVDEWHWVVETEPLYDAKTKQLTKAWQLRLAGLTVAATAYELKKLLKAEIEDREAAKMKAEWEEVLQAVQKFEFEDEAASKAPTQVAERPRTTQLRTHKARTDSVVVIKTEERDVPDRNAISAKRADSVVHDRSTLKASCKTESVRKVITGPADTQRLPLPRADKHEAVSASLPVCA